VRRGDLFLGATAGQEEQKQGEKPTKVLE